MRVTQLAVLVLAIALGIACFVRSSPAKDGIDFALVLSSLDQARLKAGAVIIRAFRTGTSGGVIVAAVDISAPRRQVWRMMLDCRNAVRVIDILERCEIVRREAKNIDVRRHVVRWGWLLPRIESVFRSYYTPPETIRFERIAGDLDRLNGVWTLRRLGAGRTRLRYKVQVGMRSLLPADFVLDAVKQDVPRTLIALRDAVERQRRQ